MAKITKRAVVDCIDRDIDGAGTINVRVSKLTYEDGVRRLRENHRTGDIPADSDLDALLAGQSAWLDSEAGGNFGAIEEESIAFAKGVAKLLHTKDRVAAARERRQERETAARLEAEAQFEAVKQREEAAATAEQAKMREAFSAFMAEMQAKA